MPPFRTTMRDGSGSVELKWITEDFDRHGNPRIYVRRRGKPMIRLREKPGTPAFIDEYRAAIARLDAPPAVDAPAKPGQPAAPGSLRWLVERYYASAEWQSLDESTRYARRRELDRFCAHRKGGDKPYRPLQAPHIVKRRDEMTEAPEGRNNLVKSLRQLFGWAMQNHVRLATANPAKDVPYIRTGSEGHHSWTLDEVEKFETRYPLGTQARLALALLLYTGMRRSDVVRLGPQHVRDGWITLTQHKGRNRHAVTLSVPLLPQLAEAIAAHPSGHLTLLATIHGRPFSPGGFTNKMRGWCDEAKLPHCSAHGLRKAGAAMAAENGASESQLMAIYGWKTMKEAARYTRKARQRVLAAGMADLLDRNRLRNRENT